MSPSDACRPTAATINHAITRLRDVLGADRVSVDATIRDAHGGDVSHHDRHAPDVVVFPNTTAEVAAIAKICSELRIPIVPFGTGTGVEGGVVALHGGVCIDVTRMKRIVHVDPINLDATVEAGVTRLELNSHLSKEFSGVHFAVDPGADASLGGMAATCASGSAAVRYGTMRENALALTVVLADGRVIKTGTRARKSSAGYDLTSLFVGSEGTLGVITELAVRLARIPAAVSAAVCAFPDIDAAVAAAVDVLATGMPIARLELLDEVQMAAVNRYSNLSYSVAPTLFFEFHGSDAGVAEQAKTAGEIVARHSKHEFKWATEKSERDRLWRARYDGYYAALALRTNAAGFVTDVCVPISNLAECIRRAKKELERTKVPAPLFGHVGDGNFHVVFALEPGNAQELAEVQELSRRVVAHALELGGTCTGEHGIGIGKLAELQAEHASSIAVMRQIKHSLDPLGIMNPGKVLAAE